MTANRCRKHHLPMADMNLPVNDRLDVIHRSRKGHARRRPGVASFTYRDRGRAPRRLPPTRTGIRRGASPSAGEVRSGAGRLKWIVKIRVATGRETLGKDA